MAIVGGLTPKKPRRSLAREQGVHPGDPSSGGIGVGEKRLDYRADGEPDDKTVAQASPPADRDMKATSNCGSSTTTTAITVPVKPPPRSTSAESFATGTATGVG